MADITLLAKYSTYEEELMGLVNSITAFAGGGQASATALTAKWNEVDTCASDYDSVKLILSKQGYQQVIFNNTAKSLSVFPVSNEYIGGIQNAEFIIPPGQIGSFECAFDGQWIGYASAMNGVLSTYVSLSSANILDLNSVPIEAIPAPGVGYAIEVISGSVKYTVGGIAYTSGGQIMLLTDTASSGQQQLINSTAFAGSSFFERFTNTIGGKMIENKAIMIQCQNADFATGNGTAKVYISYRIITV